MQHRHELRHGGHLDGLGAPDADDGTDDDSCRHEADNGAKGLRGRNERHEYDGDKGQHHAGDAEEVAALGGLLLGESCERKDEQQRCDKIRKRFEVRESVENRGVHHD